MNAKQSLLAKIKDGSFALLTSEQIGRKLRLGRAETLAVRDMLHALVREGELLCDLNGRFGTSTQFCAKKGVFSGNERGFGFFVPDDGSSDLFIPHRATLGALHGDTVLAFPVGGRSGDEGEILAIISRGYREVIGTFHIEGKMGYLHPDERKFSADIAIPRSKSMNCPNGAKAVARITSYSNGLSGEVSEILGRSGDLFVEETALIRGHKLRDEFPDNVLAEAKRVASESFEKELSKREDLRNQLIITIDGEDTRDIDDAISIREENGKFYLGVHIADVTHYVRPRSLLDEEAYARGTSVYFPDRVLPMLPKALSNGICSLNEGEDRLTLSCFMTIDHTGKVLKKRIAPTVIRSAHRMTYTDVTAIAEGKKNTIDKYPDLKDFVDTAVRLTKILQAARNARGSVTMDVKEAKILYHDGKISIPDYERTISHEMIEQFMVLANESVASIMTERNAPFIYRVHERPSEVKAEGFRTFLLEAGLKAPFNPVKVSPSDYQKLLLSIEDSPLYPLVNRIMLRSMMKAKYSAENCGHFGLASECYCHFTSPIRRYPDLAIHRIIKDLLENPDSGKKYESFVVNASAQSSECECRAAEAERDVDALFIVEYMKEKIGEVYEATISGVTSFGLFAELANTVEGFIPIDTLPDDYYMLDEDRFVLHGTRNTFRLGDRIEIKVVGVDYGTRRTQFQLLRKLQEVRR